MDDHRQRLWEEIRVAWALCLRCPLAEWRCLNDPDKRKAPTLVPPAYAFDEEDPDIAPGRKKVVFLLSHPDPVQEEAHLLGGEQVSGSPSLQALYRTFDALGGDSPISLEECGLVSALGCRPASFSTPRRNRTVTTTMVVPCSPRWHAEVRLFDPDLIVCLGHGAYAAVRPKDASPTAYNTQMGEGFDVIVPGPHGEMTYAAYVAPDALIAANRGTSEQWAQPFRFKPPLRPSADPVEFFRWHVWRALCIADFVHKTSEGEPPHPSWGVMLEALRSHHDTRRSVQEVLEENTRWAEQVRELEMGPKNVRRAMLFDDVLGHSDDEDATDYDDYEGDDDGDDDRYEEAPH